MVTMVAPILSSTLDVRVNFRYSTNRILYFSFGRIADLLGLGVDLTKMAVSHGSH